MAQLAHLFYEKDGDENTSQSVLSKSWTTIWDHLLIIPRFIHKFIPIYTKFISNQLLPVTQVTRILIKNRVQVYLRQIVAI
jgi:hypothetical protein